MNIVIKNNESMASINPLGAYLEEVKEGRENILFPFTLIPDAAGDVKKRGGSHVCLPNFGAPGAFTDLSQHGYGRVKSWTVSEQEEDRLRLELDGEGRYKDLHSVLIYEIGSKELTTSLELINNGNENLEIAPGFHPYFPTPPAAETIVVNDEELRLDSLSGTLYRDHVKRLTLGEREIRFETDYLHRFAIWTDQLGDYVCVEPTYAINSFDKKPEDNYLLEPSESMRFSFTIYWD